MNEPEILQDSHPSEKLFIPHTGFQPFKRTWLAHTRGLTFGDKKQPQCGR